jgi:hypothetical protein
MNTFSVMLYLRGHQQFVMRWIRGKYPDPLGQYVGFMPGRLG